MGVIGLKIKELRVERNISQKDLATAVGMGTTAINNYENGHRVPDAETVSRFADFFNVTADYILGRSKYRDDKEREMAQKQANDISRLLADLSPTVRGLFLSALENLLLKCGGGDPPSAARSLAGVAAIMKKVAEIEGDFAEWVIDASVFADSDNTELQWAVANEVTLDTFKVALADACSAMRKEVEGLYDDLPGIFRDESKRLVDNALRLARGDTEPRRSGGGAE
jgi:transcriptional regulator with XRE-family HTH domain